MRLRAGSRERGVEDRRKRIEREGYNATPSVQNGKRLLDIWCFKCGAKIAEAERAGPEDVIVLPPDQVEYSGPLPHPWTIVVWCQRCRARRALIQHPIGPPSPEE